MSGLYSAFKSSPKLEKEGVWRDFGYCRVRVARAGGSNQKYNSIMERVSKQHQRAIANDLIGNDRATAILVDTFAQSVITEWETNTSESELEPVWVSGIENPDGGELLPFTIENVKKILTTLPDMFIEIQEVAKGLQFYRQSLIDDAVKN